MVIVRAIDTVEEAPSHDGTPCFSAWRDYEPSVENYAGSDISNGRPTFSIQIYDTTPGSRNPQHIKTLAEHIHLATYQGRSNSEPDRDDRLDVYGLAMPVDTPNEERMNRCIAHQTAEIISRNSTGSSDFYIPGTFDRVFHRRFLIIIDRPMDQWDDYQSGEEDGGPFWAIAWGLPEEGREIIRLDDEEPLETSDVRVSLEELGDYILQSMKRCIGWFIQNYLIDGSIEAELARYVKMKEDQDNGIDTEGALGGEGVLWIEPSPSLWTEDSDAEEPGVEEVLEKVGALELESGSEADGNGKSEGRARSAGEEDGRA